MLFRLQSTEALERFVHTGGGPSQGHRGRAPVLTLRQTLRTVLMTFSMMLMQARERRSSQGSPSLVTVSISLIPSRTEAETPIQYGIETAG